MAIYQALSATFYSGGKAVGTWKNCSVSHAAESSVYEIKIDGERVAVVSVAQTVLRFREDAAPTLNRAPDITGVERF